MISIKALFIKYIHATLQFVTFCLKGLYEENLNHFHVCKTNTTHNRQNCNNNSKIWKKLFAKINAYNAGLQVGFLILTLESKVKIKYA